MPAAAWLVVAGLGVVGLTTASDDVKVIAKWSAIGLGIYVGGKALKVI